MQPRCFEDCRRAHYIRKRGFDEARITVLPRSVEVLDHVLQRLKVFGWIPWSCLNSGH